MVLRVKIDVLLKNFEPRVVNGKTKVTHEEDSNDLLVRIEYDIVGIDAPRQELEFIYNPLESNVLQSVYKLRF